jgi:S1-C subfamily serine protease
MLSTDHQAEAPAPDQEAPTQSEPASAPNPWATEAAATTPLYARDAVTPAWSAGTDGVPPALPPGYGVGNGGRKRRPGWRSAAVAIALVLALGGGIGIGKAVGSNGVTTIGGNTTVNVPTSITSLQTTLEKVAAAAKPSVVEITATSSTAQSIGSGDIITKNGYIVTNDHVVEGASNFVVTFENGSTMPAQLVGQDPSNDLAVIKVNATNLTPITFADSSKVTVGEYVVAIGTPLGNRETATFGNVSAVNRTQSEGADGPAAVLTGLIQESAPITNGNSGGALVNLQGQLIGMPTLGQTSGQSGTGSTTSVGFAIPSNQIRTVAESIINTGKAPVSTQGFMGIQGQDVNPFIAAQYGLSTQSGVLVAGFANDAAGSSPAQAAGLQTGDVIVAVNGQTITSSSDLAMAVASQKAGTKVRVTVERGTVQATVTVTLGARP